MNRYRRHDDPDPNPPMTIAEFQEHCDYVGLAGDGDIARAFSVGPKTVRRWKTGATPIPGPVRALLRTQRKVFNAGMPVEFSNGLTILPLHHGLHGDSLKIRGMLA